MDIRKWLAETEGPALSEQPGVKPFHLPRHTPAKRMRKRGSLDSSLLKTPSPQPRRKGVSADRRDRYSIPDVGDEGHSEAFHPGPGDSSVINAASQRYARRPRHKTRVDKYDIASKRAEEQDEGQRPSRKSVPGKSKGKYRRKKDDWTHNGIGQEFQGRNVSKDRLTLNPSEKLGLFRKGRSSTVVKGRGLPDLVFSEMKFLRDNRDGNDHATQAAGAKKRKKDHARTKEEDISAFFTAVRPVLAATDGNTQANLRRPLGSSAGTKADCLGITRDTSKMPDTAAPIVEPEDKPSYLEVGSRGPRHGSTSDISWSVSTRTPRVTTGQSERALPDHSIDASNRSTEEGFQARGTKGHQEVPSSVLHDRMDDISIRLRMSTAAPTPSRNLRMQSLPRPSSHQRWNLVDRAGEVSRYTYEDAASPASVPPVLQGRVKAGLPTDSMIEGAVKTSYIVEDLGSARRRASTEECPAYEPAPTLPEVGETLQHYIDIPEADSRQAPRRRRTIVQTSSRHPNIVPQTGQNWYPRFAQAGTVQLNARDVRPSVLPNFCGRGIYAQQEQRQLLPAHVGVASDGRYHFAEKYCNGFVDDVAVSNQEDLEDLSGGRTPYGLLEDIDDDNGGLDYVSEGWEQVQKPEHSSVMRPGFWRPNRLY